MKKILLGLMVVLTVIASCSKKAVPTANKALAHGADIYSKNCARCHGAQGVKDSRTPNLQTIPLNKEELVNSITNGKNYMPAFGKKLSADDISNVADLILSWHAK